jgi:hypothetical protein
MEVDQVRRVKHTRDGPKGKWGEGKEERGKEREGPMLADCSSHGDAHTGERQSRKIKYIFI